ncbi:hypothetical protein EW026_g1941 [Hermanssonia centrifuga]|uniref:DNA polymerase delta subunit 4 n=1 Tax=Hermanssonia centrifuga TaxID=98765 RepID=A0A4S4KQF8_9APHY|nr:hypothetical protein EW026_g1941 [Hermanssonia centrifuga]
MPVNSKKGKGVFRSREGAENSFGTVVASGDAVERPALDLKDKKGKWRKHFGEVRQKMGNIESIHTNGQSTVHHILRVFDLSYEYGPCVGVTRLERWERAEALGLDPPSEVKDILLTKEGSEQDEFSQCVFYGEV